MSNMSKALENRNLTSLQDISLVADIIDTSLNVSETMDSQDSENVVKTYGELQKVDVSNLRRTNKSKK